MVAWRNEHLGLNALKVNGKREFCVSAPPTCPHFYFQLRDKVAPKAGPPKSIQH